MAVGALRLADAGGATPHIDGVEAIGSLMDNLGIRDQLRLPAVTVSRGPNSGCPMLDGNRHTGSILAATGTTICPGVGPP